MSVPKPTKQLQEPKILRPAEKLSGNLTAKKKAVKKPVPSPQKSLNTSPEKPQKKKRTAQNWSIKKKEVVSSDENDDDIEPEQDLKS